MVDILSTAERRDRMASVRQKNTGPEIFVRQVLHKQGFRFRTNQNTDRWADQYKRECEEVLKRYGGSSYGKTESWLRRNVAWRLYPVLKRVPKATSRGLLFPARVWVHSGRGGDWQLTTRLII